MASMVDLDKSRIENLKRAINSRKGVERKLNVLDLNKHDSAPEGEWKDEEIREEVVPLTFEEPKQSPFFKKIFIGALAFFALSIAGAFFMLNRGSNLISPEKISVNVIAPALIPSGEKTSFEIVLTNNNESALEIADVIVEYPEGTREAIDPTKELPRERVIFGTIEPHQTVRRNISFVLYGEEKAEAPFNMVLEYRVPDSLSVFSKDVDYMATIGTSPIGIEVVADKEITSGQEIKFEVKLSSNSSELVKNVLLKVDLPNGFQVSVSKPDFLLDEGMWRVGDLEPKSVRTFILRGKIVGVQNDERFFRFSAGAEREALDGKIDAVVVAVSHPVQIKAPFLGVDIAMEGTGGEEYVAEAGKVVRSRIEFMNNLNVPITDIQIELKMSGALLDAKNVSFDDGYYDSKNGVIRWSYRDQDRFKTLLPGKKDQTNFTFTTFLPSSAEGTGLKNQELVFEVSVKGKRLSERDVPEEIIANDKRIVKIQTSADLLGRVVRGSGPIENEGPIPPEVGKRSTYTIILAVNNTLNDLNGAKIKASLPSYVEWTNIVSPTSEKISFNQDSGELEWDIGTVRSGNSQASLRQVAFQVAITPSQSQAGSSPVLLKNARLEATDSFTGYPVVLDSGELSTVLSTDPTFEFGQDRVVE